MENGQPPRIFVVGQSHLNRLRDIAEFTELVLNRVLQLILVRCIHRVGHWVVSPAISFALAALSMLSPHTSCYLVLNRVRFVSFVAVEGVISVTLPLLQLYLVSPIDVHNAPSARPRANVRRILCQPLPCSEQDNLPKSVSIVPS